jgi:AraC family transcriptional activator of mtrCDE
MDLDKGPPIRVEPHTLVITPPGQAVRFDVFAGQAVAPATRSLEARWQSGHEFLAGDKPDLTVISGCFHMSYCSVVDLFTGLSAPIVERFSAADRLEYLLKSARAELAGCKVGKNAMAAALLKEVVVTLFRRSLLSPGLWLERFSMLADRQVGRAFAEMIAEPGAPHSVSTLSETAALSRSAFLSRFNAAFGCSPMALLRRLRMRRAADLLAADTLSIDQVAHACGYCSRSSFSRAFQQVYGYFPTSA